MTQRRKYSAEFKREAVALTYQPGVSCRQIALEIGVNPNLLSRWKRESEAVSNKAFSGSGSPRDEELSSLKRELARVKKERDFLREAATFFAKQSS
ncbi:transposase [Mariprofundus micogutta]|uniref:Transposase n=1 Tax=Mariprofundus micogutta TaxID=1921010 RepID=A0A1L8CRH9_9PROT|nr:transposase [Mariprofundus micogutta]